MGQINLPSLDDITQIKDPKQQMEALLNTVGVLMKSLSEINGYLNSKNIFEAGGWRVTNTELVSKDGDVGMSTEDTGGDDVRFWAGGAVRELAPWRILNSGKMYATGAEIQSSAGYPKIIMNPTGDLFGAYLDANNSLVLSPIFGGGAPAMYFEVSGSVAATISANASNVGINAGARDLVLSTDVQGNIRLNPETGYYVVFPQGFSNIQGAGTENLAVELASKATAGISTGLSGSHNHGIPDGTVLMVDGGGTVTFSSAPTHSHAQNA